MRKPSAALVVATAALVMSTIGTSVAATHYVITSPKQVKPGTITLSALTKSARKALRGERGPAGPAGQDGEAGRTALRARRGGRRRRPGRDQAVGADRRPASVNASTPGVTALNTGTGTYAVNFGMDITRCAAIATQGSIPKFATRASATTGIPGAGVRAAASAGRRPRAGLSDRQHRSSRQTNGAERGAVSAIHDRGALRMSASENRRCGSTAESSTATQRLRRGTPELSARARRSGDRGGALDRHSHVLEIGTGTGTLTELLIGDDLPSKQSSRAQSRGARAAARRAKARSTSRSRASRTPTCARRSDDAVFSATAFDGSSVDRLAQGRGRAQRRRRAGAAHAHQHPRRALGGNGAGDRCDGARARVRDRHRLDDPADARSRRRGTHAQRAERLGLWTRSWARAGMRWPSPRPQG